MRISVDDLDGKNGFQRAYELGVNLLYMKVLFNGVEARGVTMADEEAGEITRYVVDANGKFVVTREEVVMETVRGTVRIELIEDPTGKWPHRLPRPAASPSPIDFTLMRF